MLHFSINCSKFHVQPSGPSPQNQKLHIENRMLREKTSGLLTENEELRQRLGLDTLESKTKVWGLLRRTDNFKVG